jgi:hypothetical protein
MLNGLGYRFVFWGRKKKEKKNGVGSDAAPLVATHALLSGHRQRSTPRFFFPFFLPSQPICINTSFIVLDVVYLHVGVIQ